MKLGFNYIQNIRTNSGKRILMRCDDFLTLNAGLIDKF